MLNKIWQWILRLIVPNDRRYIVGFDLAHRHGDFTSEVHAYIDRDGVVHIYREVLDLSQTPEEE